MAGVSVSSRWLATDPVSATMVYPLNHAVKTSRETSNRCAGWIAKLALRCAAKSASAAWVQSLRSRGRLIRLRDAVAFGGLIPALNVCSTRNDAREPCLEADTRFGLPFPFHACCTGSSPNVVYREPFALTSARKLIRRKFLTWALDCAIHRVHRQPGKPARKAYRKSANTKLCDPCLRGNGFQNWFEARPIIARWRRDVNKRRPHCR